MAKAFDVCMILHADHGLNNSTFTARVIISTLSDMYSAITGAIGSLRGPLHGGANEEVMEMLFEIGSIEKVEPFIMDKLKRRHEGARIMGFGHRVYKAYDPRATFLKTLAKQLAARRPGEALDVEDVHVQPKHQHLLVRLLGDQLRAAIPAPVAEAWELSALAEERALMLAWPPEA